MCEIRTGCCGDVCCVVVVWLMCVLMCVCYYSLGGCVHDMRGESSVVLVGLLFDTFITWPLEVDLVR